VELSGPPQVDPQQTRLPGRGAPSRLRDEARRGAALRGKAARDAEPAASPQLEHSLWLDFDGVGDTVSDRIRGEVNRSWRLEMDLAVALAARR
jgi:hypothetical protein